MLERANQKLEEFYYSNFKLNEIGVLWFVFLRNSNSIKLEIFETFEPKLGKIFSKLKPKLEKFIFLEFYMSSRLRFSLSMKLRFNEMLAHSTTSMYKCTYICTETM